MSWEREIPSGVEEQELFTETMHDEGSKAWQNDICRQVSATKHTVLFCSLKNKTKDFSESLVFAWLTSSR